MDFSFNPQQHAMRDAIERLCQPFDADYWRRKDSEGSFPHDFHQALASAGWLGIAMPQAYGGAGFRCSHEYFWFAPSGGVWFGCAKKAMAATVD
jgi:acyl-CoA dehydrogenase